MASGYLVAVVPVLLALAACGGEPPAPTPTSTPTPTVVPTPAPTPTVTPVPTPTATPTVPPPTATPTPVPTFSPGQVILPMGPIPTPSATVEVADPLARRLDGIGLRMNVLRELTSKKPIERHFITREDLRARLVAIFEEDREETENTEALYLLLGMMDVGDSLNDIQLSLLGEGVLGYFDPEDETFFMVEQGDEFGPAEEVVFVHEYVHGLQQQHFDIQSTLDGFNDGDNGDAASAYRALLEGDAYLADALYVQEHMEPDERAASQPEASQELIEAFQSAPQVVQRQYIFVFQEALFFVISLYQQGGWDVVTAAFDDIPVSTEQVLHPERYLAGEQPVAVTVPDLSEALGEGWSEVMEDTMGEFLLRTYLELGAEFGVAAQAADGWGGDRLRLYASPDGKRLMVQSIVWDTEDEAHEFYDIFLEFTQSRTGGEWETVEGEASAAQMALDDLDIFVGLDGAATLLIYAPDASTVETVRGALAAEQGASGS